jgi:hypothetical protein
MAGILAQRRNNTVPSSEGGGILAKNRTVKAPQPRIHQPTVTSTGINMAMANKVDKPVKPAISSEAEWYSKRPVLNFLANNPVSKVLNKLGTANDVAGESLRASLIGQKPSEAITTGNKTADTILRGVGTVESFFLPGGVGASAGLVRGAAGQIANKIIPKVGNIGARTANRAVLGAVESLPYTAQQLIQEKPKDIGSAAKTAGINTLLGAGGESLIGGAADVVGKLRGKNPTAQVTLPNTPELPKIEAPKVELPKPSNKVVMEPQKNKFSFKEAWTKFRTAATDNQAAIGDFSKKAGDSTSILASNSRNVGGTVDYILRDGLVDRAGNKIGLSLREASEKIPKGKEEDFWTYMSQRHNIDRARENKNVIANYTTEMSEQAVKEIEAANPGFKSAGDEVTNWIDKFMREWGVKAGTVDEQIYNDLRQTYKSYFPTQREFSQLESSMPDSVRKQFVDNVTPIRKATGSERDINNPIENIMNLVNRTVRTARYNEVGQSLLNSVRQSPDKLRELAEVIPTQEGMFANTDNVISVLEGGKPVYLRINDKMLLDALKGLPRVINNAKVMRAISNGFKGLITQKNPLFAIRNIFRDVPTAYIYGSTANPFKFGADLVKAGRDIVTNGENFQRYRAVGGGGSNFFSQGAEKAAQNLNKGGFHPLEAIEYFNNMTETAPRLAEFTRVLEKTGDVQKALDAANNVTVNFARGGNVTKAAEPFVPYLNAGVQGLDRFFRAFKDPKTAVSTLIKGGIAITAPEVALYLINKDDPNYQALDNRTKDTYFLIPKGDGTFWKIPKSRELGVLFGSLFQRSMRAQEGEENAFKGFGNTLATNFSPANPIENNILAPLAINIPKNKDFAGRSIVPQGMIMDKRSPYLQFDEKSTEIAKAIGQYANAAGIEGGLSPKQIDYLIKSYTGIIGQLGMPATTKGGDPLKTISQQFTSDPTYSNQALTDFYDNSERYASAAKDNNLLNNIPSGDVTPQEQINNMFSKASEKMSELNKLNSKVVAGTLTSDDIKALQAYGVFVGDAETTSRQIKGEINKIAAEANKLKPEQFTRTIPDGIPTYLTQNKERIDLTYPQQYKLADMIDQYRQQREEDYRKLYEFEQRKDAFLKKALEYAKEKAYNEMKRELFTGR